MEKDIGRMKFDDQKKIMDESRGVSKDSLIEIYWWWFRLRKRNQEDLISLQENANNPKIQKFLFDTFPYPYSIDDAKNRIDYNNAVDTMKELNLAIEVDGKAIWGIGFIRKDWNNKKSGFVWYRLWEKYWGNWITSKAIKSFVDFVFEKYDIQRLEASVFEWNEGSMRVLNKNGFMYEGTLRKNIYKESKSYNEKIYSILREEWDEKKDKSISNNTNNMSFDIIKRLEWLSQKKREEIFEEFYRRKRDYEMRERWKELPKLENENFKLSEGITEKWKIKNGIRTIDDKKIRIKIRENKEKDIYEYVEGVPQELIGQQLFTWDAAQRETNKLWKELPDIDVYYNDFQRIMDSMPWDNEDMRYQQFLIRNNMLFPGFRYPWWAFVGIGEECNLWSKNSYNNTSARYSQFLKNSWLRIEYHKRLAFSVRCKR